MILPRQILTDRQLQRRILRKRKTAASLFRHPRPCKEIPDIDPRKHRKDQPHLRENAETSADAIRHREARPAILLRQRTQRPLLLVRHRDDAHLAELPQHLTQRPLCHDRLQSRPRLRIHDQQHLVLPPRCLRAPPDAVHQREKTHRIQILPRKIQLRIPVALLLRHQIPILSAEQIKKHLISKIRAPDTDRHHDILLLRQLREREQPLPLLFGDQNLFLQKIRQMREKHETAVRPLPALPKPLYRKRRLMDALLAGIDLLLRDPPALAGKMRHIDGQFILKMHTYTPASPGSHSCCHLSTIIISCFCPARECFTAKGELKRR